MSVVLSFKHTISKMKNTGLFNKRAVVRDWKKNCNKFWWTVQVRQCSRLGPVLYEKKNFSQGLSLPRKSMGLFNDILDMAWLGCLGCETQNCRFFKKVNYIVHKGKLWVRNILYFKMSNTKKIEDTLFQLRYIQQVT